ncbi:MAG: hypothetical protein WCO90_10275 [Planctomycetota bacterium]
MSIAGRAVGKHAAQSLGHEIGEPIEKLKRRELDDAIVPWPRGRSAGFHRVSCGDKISSCRSCTLKTCSHMERLYTTG